MPTLVSRRRRAWFANFYGNARFFRNAALKLSLKDYSPLTSSSNVLVTTPFPAPMLPKNWAAPPIALALTSRVAKVTPLPSSGNFPG
jgi:hypothetical protein